MRAADLHVSDVRPIPASPAQAALRAILGLLKRGPADGSGPAQRGAGPEFGPDVLATEVGAIATAAVRLSTSEPRAS